LWLFDLIWKACRRHAERVEREHLDRQYELSYRRLPEEPALPEALAGVSAWVLEEERW
jgi:hypothetical protein